MVGADDLVAIGNVGARPEEQCAVVLQRVAEPEVAIGHHLHVLGGDAVSDLDHLVVAVADDDLAKIFPGLAGGFAGREYFEQPLDLGHGVARQLLGVGEEDGGGGGAVFGLTEEVGGAELAVDGLVGDHQGFGRAGEEVDTDLAVELALGFGNIGVTGADEHVDGLDRLGADGHGADRLDAAEHVDLVGAGHVLGSDDGGSGNAVEGRGAGDDASTAGDLGGEHRHVGGGKERIFAARHVAADGSDRHVLVAKRDAGEGLDGELLHGVLLGLGEVAHLGLSEGDVGKVLGGELADAGIDLGLAEAEIGAVPAVELAAQVADGVVAALLDITKNALDRRTNLSIGLGALFDRLALLKPMRQFLPHAKKPTRGTLLCIRMQGCKVRP